MTYPNDPESATELPAWTKWLRGLVFALMIVSILAMVSVIWAAFRVVATLDSGATGWPEAVTIEEGAEPVSMTRMDSGEFLLIYKIGAQYYGRITTSEGDVVREVEFQ